MSREQMLSVYERILLFSGLDIAGIQQQLDETVIDQTQAVVNGEVRLRLYKGNVIVAGRRSPTHSLFDESIATFEDDAGAYDQKDAGGFIKLNALRLRVGARRKF